MFCEQDPLLFALRYPAKEAHQRIMEMSRLPITLVQPGDEFYLDLRYFSTLWYDQLELPEYMSRRYVLKARYVGWRRTVKGAARIIAEVVFSMNVWHLGITPKCTFLAASSTAPTICTSLTACSLRITRLYYQRRHGRCSWTASEQLPRRGKRGVMLQHAQPQLHNS